MHLGENQTPQNSQTFYKLDTKCCPGKVGENSLAFQDINLTSTKRFFGIPISPWGKSTRFLVLITFAPLTKSPSEAFQARRRKLGLELASVMLTMIQRRSIKGKLWKQCDPTNIYSMPVSSLWPVGYCEAYSTLQI